MTQELTFTELRHRQKLGLEPLTTGKKPPKPIPQQSKKRVREQRKYVKIVAAAAAKDNECEVKIKGVCTFFMSGMHHVIKRSPDNFIKRENLLRCCTPCNGWIEQNSKQAKELGFVISKFKKWEH